MARGCRPTLVLFQGQESFLHQLVGGRRTVTAPRARVRGGALGSGTMALGGRRGRVTPGLDSKYRHGGIPAILLHLIPSCVSFPPLPAPHPLLPITLRCTHPREGPSPCQASEAGKGRTEPCGPPVLGPYLSPAHWGPSVPWSSWVSLVAPVLPAIPPSSGSPGPPGFPCPLDHLGSPLPWSPLAP